jgi:hypothetical protein
MHLKGKREQLCSAKNTGTRLSLTLISSMESTMIFAAHILAVILKIRSWRRFVQSTKKIAKKKRPFAFEHWWRVLKDQPKWSKRSPHPVEEMQKRARFNESGAYTSSTQETEGVEDEVRRPQGQKAAKAE